ncbi:hypothetical protein A8990_1437 [Paenibacillus taihuensis]|uniref:TniQ protein n=1 Tax=Paenibacillus taihuensis TaxID=1156355 RepID=A0A3D9R0F3_9BACL|nr:hypothetical protein A8990_1437 [Paenibacillus taihuensis]
MLKLTWDPAWMNPFESHWSIIEKIKYANAITSLDFVRLYGTRNFKGKLRNQHKGLFHFIGIDHNLLFESISTDLSRHTEYYLNKMTGMFSWVKTDRLLRKEFSFCDDCLSMGYHSLFHQFIFLNKCPFHLSPLSNSCKYCGGMFSCDKHNHKSKNGFQCSCSNYFVEPKFNTWSDWQMNLTIKNTLVERWVTMDLNAYNRINKSFFYVPALINMDAPLQFLLDFGNKRS